MHTNYFLLTINGSEWLVAVAWYLFLLLSSVLLISIEFFLLSIARTNEIHSDALQLICKWIFFSIHNIITWNFFSSYLAKWFCHQEENSFNNVKKYHFYSLNAFKHFHIHAFSSHRYVPQLIGSLKLQNNHFNWWISNNVSFFATRLVISHNNELVRGMCLIF